MKEGVNLARKTFSITMEDDRVAELDKIAKQNHRKRGPEINVAVELYLKYQNVDIEAAVEFYLKYLGIDIENELRKHHYDDIKSTTTNYVEINQPIKVEDIEGTEVEDDEWSN